MVAACVFWMTRVDSKFAVSAISLDTRGRGIHYDFCICMSDTYVVRNLFVLHVRWWQAVLGFLVVDTASVPYARLLSAFHLTALPSLGLSS